MLHIHSVLKADRFPNTTRLATDLEVSRKTVQRDLEFMRDRLRLPLEYDARKYGYYYSEPVESFPNLQLSEGELFALLIAEKAAQQYRGSPFESRLKGILDKIAGSLPETVTLHLADWDEAISFRTTVEPVAELPVVDTLAQAIQQRNQLQITYRKPGNPTAEKRIIDPYHLANVNGEWYLFAHDHLRKDLRTFVPSRIQQIESTGIIFQRPEKFTLEQRLQDSFGVHSKQGDYRVIIQFDEWAADYIREKRWHASQELVELPEGGAELRLRLGSLSEIQRWVLSWAGHARVLAPKELVESVQEAARRILSTAPVDTPPR